MIEVKPEPEPGWSPSLWPKGMTLERICVEARLHSWKALIGYLIACVALLGLSVLCLLSVLYSWGSGPTGRGWVAGIIGAPISGLLTLCVVITMVAKRMIAPRSGKAPEYGTLERLLPMTRKKQDQ